MRAALAHNASIAPPCTFSPIVQCRLSIPSKTLTAPSDDTGVSRIASLNRVESSM
jgi:hypothetical protein